MSCRPVVQWVRAGHIHVQPGSVESYRSSLRILFEIFPGGLRCASHEGCPYS